MLWIAKTTLQHNKLIQLENSMLMYGIFNAETLEKLINTVCNTHNTTSFHKKLFAGQQRSLTLKSLYANVLGLKHYSINTLLYLRTVQDKYVSLYKELITQLYIYATTIRLLVSIITPLKLKEILVKLSAWIAIRKTNPDYDLVIKRLHLYYDMKLVTFGITKDRNFITQFQVSIQPYTQQPLILYQIEIVPIINQNKQAHSYTHLQIYKQYIVLNSETYHNKAARIKNLQENRL